MKYDKLMNQLTELEKLTLVPEGGYEKLIKINEKNSSSFYGAPYGYLTIKQRKKSDSTPADSIYLSVSTIDDGGYYWYFTCKDASKASTLLKLLADDVRQTDREYFNLEKLDKICKKYGGIDNHG